MPYVEKNYRVSADRANTAIAGLSMGGSQTLNIAMAHPDRFAYIGVYSSGLLGVFPVGGRGGAAAPAATGPADWETRNAAALSSASMKKGLKLFWFSTGKDDFLLDNTVATVDLFKKHGFTPVYKESAGGHTWLNWRDYLNAFAPQLFQVVTMASAEPLPCIITVAITGSVPRKENNPAVPITVTEQIESTHEAFEAGAALVHVHVRNDDQSTTSNPDKFAEFQERIRKLCPGIIVQFSTGGRSGVGSERGGMLHHRPDMASLSTGSVNFPTRVYENPPDLIRELAGKMMQYGVKPEIEVFDLAMLYNAIDYAREGMLTSPLHVQFVLGVKHAQPADRDILEFEVAQAQVTDARRDVGRRGHRPPPARRQSLVSRDGRALPHRTRRQRALGQEPSRDVECRARVARR